MADPLPPGVRELLGRVLRFGAIEERRGAESVLARYPVPSLPEPEWEDGDAALIHMDPEPPVAVLMYANWWRDHAGALITTPSDTGRVELIASSGRRVYPARFHDHAEHMREASRFLVDIGTPGAIYLAERLSFGADDVEAGFAGERGR